MAKKKDKPEMIKPSYPKVIETFREVGEYEISGMRDAEPSCFNYKVSFRKYRITVELVDEPSEILGARLEKMWIECANHHHWQPLENAAASIGYKFKGANGSQRKK